jgi:negative regulator of sigma E activity
MAEAAARAKLAEQRRDDALANAEWRRYRLIRDVNRSPDELLAEGIELCEQAAELVAAMR